jgi:heptosyltransferase-3
LQHLFLGILSGLFLNGYIDAPANRLWIKRGLRFLFCHTGLVRRLVIRPGAIGDLIVSLPALESLRTAWFEAWVAAPNVPLVRFADCARAIASSGLDLLGIADPPPGLLEQLRSFDSIVSWYGANRPEFRELIRQLNLPVIFLPALPPDAAAVHATDFYLDQVRGLCPSTVEAIPRIRCEVPREDFAVIHPFSGSVRKNWPLDKFRQLARGLERNMRVHWCAGPEDPPLAGAVRIARLYELACWLARARLYVGNDSGITHLAAAVGTPVLALFGPTNPEIWAPRGPNVRVLRWKA